MLTSASFEETVAANALHDERNAAADALAAADAFAAADAAAGAGTASSSSPSSLLVKHCAVTLREERVSTVRRPENS